MSNHILPREPVEEDHDFSSSYVERLQKRLKTKTAALKQLAKKHSVPNPIKDNYDYTGNYLDRIRSLNKKRKKKRSASLGDQVVVGLDIDDTLTDTSIEFTNELNKRGHSLKEEDKKESRWHNIPGSGVSREEEDAIFKQFLDEKTFERLQPDPAAKPVMDALKKAGARIVLITARPEAQLKESTEKWLKQHDLPYDALYFTTDKASVVAKEKVDFLVDDDLKNAFDTTKVIAFARPWNQNYKGKRISSLEEVLNFVETLNKTSNIQSRRLRIMAGRLRKKAVKEYFDEQEILELLTDGLPDLKIEMKIGDKKDFAGCPMQPLPFAYGEIPNYINPVDDMGWDVIIVPSAVDLPKEELIPIGIMRYNQNVDFWDTMPGEDPIGNDKILLGERKGNTGAYTEEDKNTLMSFVKENPSFESPTFFINAS